MKNILIGLVAVLYFFVGTPVNAEEKVQVYMFSKDGCSACIAAQEYFHELEEEHGDLFELNEIFVFDENFEPVDNDRTNLLVKVYERFGEDSSNAATPTIVIGDFHSIGLPQDTNQVYEAIVNAKDNKTEDEVKKIVDELELDMEDLLEYDAKYGNNVSTSTEPGKYDTLIIVSIFVVLVGGLVGLVIAGKK